MYLYYLVVDLFFFFKQKTAYEMRISDWSSDVCSSDLLDGVAAAPLGAPGGDYPAIEVAVAGGIAFLCAEAVGAMEVACDTTLEYLKTRKQIGKASCRECVCQYV